MELYVESFRLLAARSLSARARANYAGAVIVTRGRKKASSLPRVIFTRRA